jgi:DNA helicase-2/ATP-dependent DNA helicase PcrA
MGRALGDPDEEEEERRLMYVAMTRARNDLMVTYPLNTYSSRMSADYSIDQLSRFLDRGVRDTMQRVVLADDTPAPPPSEPAGTPLLDLRAVLRGRFGSA